MMKKIFILVCILWVNQLAHAQSTNTNSVDLLWQAETYQPPFYAGHSQPSPASTVQVAAITNILNSAGNKLKPSDLIFTWEKDQQSLPDLSGRGRDKLEFFTDTGEQTNEIKVTVTTPDKLIKEEKQINIKNQTPKLILYEDDPLLGLDYHQAIVKTYNLTKPEVSLVVEPYFFSQTAVTGKKLDFNWLLNNKKIVPNPGDPRQITFVAPDDGGTGENSIAVTATNRDNVLQQAASNLSIRFGVKNVNF